MQRQTRLNGPRLNTSPTRLDAQAVWDRVSARLTRVMLELDQIVAAAITGELGEADRERGVALTDRLVTTFGDLGLSACVDGSLQIRDALVRAADSLGLPAELSSLLEDLHGLVALTGNAAAPADPDAPTLAVVGASNAYADAILWAATTQGWHVTLNDAFVADADAVCMVFDSKSPDTESAERTLVDLAARVTHPIVVCDPEMTLGTRVRLAPYATSILSGHSPAMVMAEVRSLSEQWRVKPTLGIFGPAAETIAREMKMPAFDVITVTDVGDVLLQARLGQVHGLLLPSDLDRATVLSISSVVRSDPAARHIAVIASLADGHYNAASVAEILEHGADEVQQDRMSRDVRAAACATLLRGAVRGSPTRAAQQSTSSFSRRHAILIIERMLVSAHQRRTAVSLGVLEFDAEADGLASSPELEGALNREFRRGDVIGRWDDNKYVIALAGVGRRTATRRLDDLLRNLGLGGNCRVAVVEFPTDGGALEDLAASAESMLARARFEDGPRVVSAEWHGRTLQGADVLVVDPDATLRALVVTLLERDEMTVVQLNDAVAALDYLTGPSERALPRVLLMELDLMGMDGLALLRKLRESGVLSRMRVLVLTARIREAELLEALELGASDYVTKPFAPALLLHRLRRVMAS